MTTMIPESFLKILAIWSLIPAYLAAGGLIGYGLDAWWNTFPYVTGIGLIIALAVAVKDMLRLRDYFMKG